MKKTTTVLMALAFSATAVLAQDKPAATVTTSTTTTKTTTTTTTADPVIISAGDIAIHQSEFESALKTLPAQYQEYAMGPGKKQFAEDYLRMKMLAAKGYAEGLQNDAEVTQQLNLMRDNLVANAELARIEKGVTVSEDDLKKAYEAKKGEYEQVKARHILVAFKGSPAAQPGKKELTEAEAKAKAEDLRKQLVAGADFAELAKKESDDTGSGSRGGELGTFGRGQMVPEFETAAFALKPGEISQVVRTQFGFHIIKVDEHKTTSFDEARAQLEKTERQAKVQQTLEAMKTGSNAVYNSTYFAPPATAAPATDEKPAADKDKPAATKDTKKPAAKKQ